MIQKERIKPLNDENVKNKENIFYWMQASQRTNYNHALEFAIERANKLNKSLSVFFVLTTDFPEANLRHYQFMLEGLREVREKLAERELNFNIFLGDPKKIVTKIAKKAALIITDRDYLKETRKWRKNIADSINCPLVQVESNLIVPVEDASSKEEYAAYTIRKKINKKLDYYLKELDKRKTNNPSLNKELELETELKEKDITKFLKDDNLTELTQKLDIDKKVKPVSYYKGGEEKAREYLYDFITNKLDKYHELSNDPTKDYLSQLGPYLHFGQISPLLVALEVKEKYSPGQEDFLDQLIVRRELSFNFVYYNKDYDKNLKAILPDWAYTTLEEHKDDLRKYIYSKDEFEKAATHDKYWNAAQKEMKITGKMHGYMRMYWAKKILEWTPSPQDAFEIALYLNNKYSLDGRDPNSFAGIAWCFGKHDRAWQERKVFGKTRYMNANGLNRKFAADLYVQQIDQLTEK
ncbi:MAG: deoxyribodipyrimidine photo-lyase [Bacillota bacterium]